MKFVSLGNAVIGVALFAGWFVPASVQAIEYPAGKPQQRAGMEIAAVYLQPVEMEPAGMMRTVADSDIHLEADIRAVSNNPNGYPEGEWIPYLMVRYELSKQGDGKKVEGILMPMVANDGPHYGDNIKLMGPGKYHLKYTVYPPNSPGNLSRNPYGRHTDRLTGVRPWFQPFTLEYDFTFVGVGKAGGY